MSAFREQSPAIIQGSDMNEFTPFVRHMLLCDHAQSHPGNSRKVNIFGLLHGIRSDGELSSFPLNHSFTVYLALTEGRGDGQMQIAVTLADTGKVVYESPAYSVEFDNDPLRVFGVIIHVTTCSFPHSGLYFVEFRYNGHVLARQPVEVK